MLAALSRCKRCQAKTMIQNSQLTPRAKSAMWMQTQHRSRRCLRMIQNPRHPSVQLNVHCSGSSSWRIKGGRCVHLPACPEPTDTVPHVGSRLTACGLPCIFLQITLHPERLQAPPCEGRLFAHVTHAPWFQPCYVCVQSDCRAGSGLIDALTGAGSGLLIWNPWPQCQRLL